MVMRLSRTRRRSDAMRRYEAPSLVCDMADTFLVQIDLFELGVNLSKAGGESMTRERLLSFLRDNDIKPAPDRGDGWFVAEEISLRLLDKSEIIATERFA